jgi:hypothetical protein
MIMCQSYNAEKLRQLNTSFQAGLTDLANSLAQYIPELPRVDSDDVRDTVSELTERVANILDEFAFNAPLDENGIQAIHNRIQEIAGVVSSIVAVENARLLKQAESEAAEVGGDDSEGPDLTVEDYSDEDFMFSDDDDFVK